MKWLGSFQEDWKFYVDCVCAILGGFWEGFTKGITEDEATWFLLALALLAMVIVIVYGR